MLERGSRPLALRRTQPAGRRTWAPARGKHVAGARTVACALVRVHLTCAQTGTHPRVTTERNINRFRQQLQMLGFSYDWDREVSTTDPKYYK